MSIDILNQLTQLLKQEQRLAPFTKYSFQLLTPSLKSAAQCPHIKTASTQKANFLLYLAIFAINPIEAINLGSLIVQYINVGILQCIATGQPLPISIIIHHHQSQHIVDNLLTVTKTKQKNRWLQLKNT